MKILKSPSFFVWREVTWGMNKNNHIRVSRCIVAMVTAIIYGSLRPMFLSKISLSIVNLLESRSRVHGN